MSDPITREIFDHLVELGALELAPQEAEYLRQQLNNQLKAVQELEAIPLEADLPLASHGVAYPPEASQALRKDTWAPYPNAQAIMAQAPELDDGFIVVPDIPHTQLD
jgi:aspartyl-tRNA(Asn)/glutamyl-tRNA(Gln) amidotransferase subunit C